MKANQKAVNVANAVNGVIAVNGVKGEFTSLRDMGYKQAKTGDMLRAMALYAKANIAGFPETVTPEGKAELYDGYRLRFGEITPSKMYAIVGDNYIPIDDNAKTKPKEQVEISVAYAFSFTQQEFGQLKSKNTQLHAIVKDIRDKTNVYCSNRLGDLKTYAKEGKAKGTRPQALAFDEWLKGIFSDIKKRAKTANSRGENVNEKKLAEAIVEFNVKYNHGE